MDNVMFNNISVLKIAFILLSILTIGCSGGNKELVSESTDSLAISATLLNERPSFPELDDYIKLIDKSLLEEVPIVPLQRELSDGERVAQELCFGDPKFKSFVKDSSGKSYRNEIFGIYPARESDFSAANKVYYVPEQCFRVEMYNFARNVTTIGIVNPVTSQIIQVSHFIAMQPELPEHLKDLAIKMALESQQVIDAMEIKPEMKHALMADTKTALNNSRCERSKHLCVAPTFVKDKKALWTIIDLTDLRVAGLRWTNLGETAVVTQVVSERKIQNESITNCYCKTSVPLKRNGWELDYMITGNDGLRISDVRFNNKAVINSAKLVDWHVSYSNTEGFGYSDAVGCPYFSSATVIAIDPPKIAEIIQNGEKVGFSIEQFFRSDAWPSPCNYQYFQRFEFYNDGKFRTAAASIGRGCGNDGTYRPVFRISFAGDAHQLGEWTGERFEPIENEGWRLQQFNTRYDKFGAMFNIKANGENYRIVPGNGQFGDGGRGDNAYVYFTRYKPDVDEGESDLPTIGPCCNNDYQQGPEKFIDNDPESLKNSQVVLWYVPQIKNDDTKGKEYCWAEARLVNGVYQTEMFPCIAGPMFIPESIQ
jgi:hypothetical protein